MKYASTLFCIRNRPLALGLTLAAYALTFLMIGMAGAFSWDAGIVLLLASAVGILQVFVLFWYLRCTLEPDGRPETVRRLDGSLFITLLLCPSTVVANVMEVGSWIYLLLFAEVAVVVWRIVLLCRSLRYRRDFVLFSGIASVAMFYALLYFLFIGMGLVSLMNAAVNCTNAFGWIVVPSTAAVPALFLLLLAEQIWSRNMKDGMAKKC